MIKNHEITNARQRIKSLYRDNYGLYNYYMGLSFCGEEKYNEAFFYFENSIGAGLDNYLVYYNLSVCCLKMNYYKLSITYLKRCIKKNKNFEKSYINLSSIYFKLGDLKKSYRTIEAGLCCCTTQKMQAMEKYIYNKILSK